MCDHTCQHGDGSPGGQNIYFCAAFTWEAKNGIEKNLNKFCCHKHEIHLGHCHIAHCAENFSEAKCPFVSIVFNSSLVLKFSWLAGLSTLYEQDTMFSR